MRFCGGKISDVLNQHEIHTLGDIQKTTFSFLTTLLGGDETKSSWLLGITNGICDEKVEQKGFPTSAMGIKTFRMVRTFKELEKFILLCVLDIIQKMQDYMEDFKIFPTKFVINYRNNND